MEFSTIYLVLAGCIGLIMAFGVGANDVANAIGTSVGAKALTIRQAIVVAAIFESLGAMLAGGEVTNTIRSQIINPVFLEGHQELLVYGMMASSLSAGAWLLIASHKGWPVSTTHSIIGAIIGFGAITIGVNAIYWGKVIEIMSSWVLTPIIAGFCSYFIFYTIQLTILNKKRPLYYAKVFLPMYVGFAALVVSFSTVTKGLYHLGIEWSCLQEILFSILFSAGMVVVSIIMLRRIEYPKEEQILYDFKQVEKAFGILMIFTACSMAYAHGSNDVANAIGPLAAVVDVVANSSNPGTSIPIWILLVGAVGIVLGLVCYGYKIIATIGKSITVLTPSRGFAAEISAASTVVMASATGLPVSTTQTLVGAILGVGLAGGIGAINLTVIRKIFMSWFITLPAGALMAVIFYYLLRLGFSFF